MGNSCIFHINVFFPVKYQILQEIGVFFSINCEIVKMNIDKGKVT